MSNRLLVVLEVASKGVNQIAKLDGQVKRFTTNVHNSFKQLATLPNLIAGALVGRMVKGFIDAGAQIEVFSKQLQAVTGSAQEADTALAAIREFARQSPIDTEDAIAAYVRMRAVGIDPTIEQMKTLGGVSLLFNRKMTDTLQAFIGMEKEPLRNLGVEIDRTGAQAIITSGNMKRVVEKDAVSVRTALLDIWEKRFPNAIETAADTFSAKMSIFRSNWFEFKAQVADSFLSELGGSVDGINTAFESLISNIPKISFAIWAVITPVRILWEALKLISSTAITALILGFQALVIAFEAVRGASVILEKTLFRLGDILFYVGTGQWGKLKELGKSVAQTWDSTTRGIQSAVDMMSETGKVWLDDLDKSLDNTANSMVALQNKYNAMADTTSKPVARLTGTGAMGAGTGGAGSGGPGGAESKSTLEMVSSHYNTMEEYEKAYREKFRSGLTELKEGTWEWLQVFGTSHEKMAFQMQGVWTNFTSGMEGRFKSAFDTMTSLSTSWADKFKALTEQVYRAGTDLIFGYLSTYVKAKLLERTTAIATERAKTAAALKTAAAEGAGAAAAAGKSVAGTPLIGPILAIAAIAAVAGAVFSLMDKSKGYAVGTQYAQPGLHWVGERGPELMSFKGGEKVFTNNQSKQIASQGGAREAVFNFYDQSGGLVESMRGKIRSHEMDTVVDDLIERMKQRGS